MKYHIKFRWILNEAYDPTKWHTLYRNEQGQLESAIDKFGKFDEDEIESIKEELFAAGLTGVEYKVEPA